MGGTAAVRETLVTLCCTALFKAKKEPTKMPSKKKKKIRNSNTHRVQTKLQKAKNILLFTPSI